MDSAHPSSQDATSQGHTSTYSCLYAPDEEIPFRFEPDDTATVYHANIDDSETARRASSTAEAQTPPVHRRRHEPDPVRLRRNRQRHDNILEVYLHRELEPMVLATESRLRAAEEGSWWLGDDGVWCYGDATGNEMEFDAGEEQSESSVSPEGGKGNRIPWQGSEAIPDDLRPATSDRAIQVGGEGGYEADEAGAWAGYEQAAGFEYDGGRNMPEWTVGDEGYTPTKSGDVRWTTRGGDDADSESSSSVYYSCE
jgi:hypothetical protein